MRTQTAPAGGSGGPGQASRETPDPVAQLAYRRVEAGGITGRDRVRDGPVHSGLATEFLASHITDRNHQVAFILDLADVPRPKPGQRQPVAAGGLDRARVDRRPGMSTS